MQVDMSNSVLTLASIRSKLSDRDLAFADSLVSQYEARGRLSDKQMFYVNKLIASVASGEAREAREAPAGSSDVSFVKLAEMFDKAAAELTRPRVMFAADGVGEFQVRRAGDNSRNPGYLYVTFDGEYVGKIEPLVKGARFYATRECPAAVVQSLTKFNSDPVKAAVAYGQATGNCCFCARKLDDPRSVEVGYGPICADRFGLPWGA